MTEENKPITIGNLSAALASLSGKFKEYLAENYSGPLNYIQRLFGYTGLDQDPKDILGGYGSVGEMAKEVRRLRKQYEALTKLPEAENGQGLDELISRLIEEKLAGKMDVLGQNKLTGEIKDYIGKEVGKAVNGDGSGLQEIEQRLELLREGTGDSWEELEKKVTKRKKGSGEG